MLPHDQTIYPPIDASIHQQLRIEPLTDRPGLRLIGEVDLNTRDAFTSALERVVADGDVHLDVAALTFIDAAGATAVVRFAARLGAGRHVVLHDPRYPLRRVLDLLWGALPTIRMEKS